MFLLTACKQSHIEENFALRVSQTQYNAAHKNGSVSSPPYLLIPV